MEKKNSPPRPQGFEHGPLQPRARALPMSCVVTIKVLKDKTTVWLATRGTACKCVKLLANAVQTKLLFTEALS